MKRFSTLSISDLIHTQPPPLPIRFVAGGVIFDSAGRILILQRSFSNKSYPGCWEVPGGYIEEGESLLTGLFREIKEETSLTAQGIHECIKTFEWKKDEKEEPTHIFEFIFVVTLAPNNHLSVIDKNEFESFYWISEEEIDMVMENRTDNDPWMIEVLTAGFEWYRAHSSKLPDIYNEEIKSLAITR